MLIVVQSVGKSSIDFRRTAAIRGILCFMGKSETDDWIYLELLGSILSYFMYDHDKWNHIKKEIIVPKAGNLFRSRRRIGICLPCWNRVIGNAKNFVPE